MRKLLTSGLIILLPILLTAMMVNFLINLFTTPFLGFMKTLLFQWNWFQHPLFLLSEETLAIIMSKVIILFFLITFISLVGRLGQIVFIHSMFSLGDCIFHHTPVINKIYKACQDVVHSLFSSSKTFSHVVFVPFPNPHALAIGLITQDSLKTQTDAPQGGEWISVFIPGTPIPSIGFMLMFKREQLIFVDMKVNEAMKFIVSCGIVIPQSTTPYPQSPTSYENNSSSEDHLLPSER